jgi:hypothetical protein
LCAIFSPAASWIAGFAESTAAAADVTVNAAVTVAAKNTRQTEWKNFSRNLMAA